MAGFNYLRTFIIITVTAFANLSMAQNLTLDQLIAMKSQSVAHIDEALTLKNWQMTEAEESTDTTLSHATYAYGKSSYDDKALSFLSVYFRPYDTNRILLQVNSRSAYNNYMARIKALGFRLQASRIEDGSVVKLYRTLYTRIKISTSTSTDEMDATRTSYSFIIIGQGDNLFDEE